MVLAYILFAVLLACGVPIALVLAIPALPPLMDRGIPLIVVAQTVFEALDSFALMAIPFYVLAGRLMQSGGIARRLVALALACVGWMRGGLAGATVLTTMFFATMSGSSTATAAAVGGVMVPEMRKKGYPARYGAAVIASSAELGAIIPPSVPMILYAVVASVSITDLFLAGILPGLLIGCSLIVANLVFSAVKQYGERSWDGFGSWFRSIADATGAAFLSLLMPGIILGGIYGGFFTPTEAGVVAVVYALILGVCVYREIRISELPRLFAEAAVTASVVMIIVGFASVFAYVLALYGVPQAVGRFMQTITSDPLVFLLLVNLFLFGVGMFIETFAAIIILAPVLAPAAAAFGIDPVHFGLVMIVNLAIGMVTPPVGVNLFVACSIANIKLEEIMPPLLVFLAVLVIDLMIITYVPFLSLAFIR